MARTPKRFTDQTDTPNTKVGGALKLVRVNVGETDLEYAFPNSATLTRDGNGAVETVTVTGGSTWTISRNPNESVASLTDTVYLVEVDRDGNGVITGVTASVV
jgi:hypothetical protein